MTADEFPRIVFSYSVTFWVGLLALGGLALTQSPLPELAGLPGHGAVGAVGWILMGAVAAFLIATMVREAPLRLSRFTLPLPTPALAARQLLVSAIDWSLAAAALYVLLPPSDLSGLTFLGAYLVAVLLGMVSHGPGGVGVFEGLMVLLLKPYLTSGQLLPALVVYRVVYYLLPLAIAMVALVADEVHQRRVHVARAGAWLGVLTQQMTPRVLATFSFLSGGVLLWSGATPASPGRLDIIDRVIPLGVVEASHFLGSIAGAGLLVLSQGLARRLDAAYYLSSALILLGMTASLLKGFDYEEAALLLVVLLALHRARPAFDRRPAFFDTRFSTSWMAALAGALAASVWLGLFAFKHVDYSQELWWQFELHGEASRFLRASVGAAIVVLLVGIARLLRHARHEVEAPLPSELAAAESAIQRQQGTVPNLVFLRDKALLFNDARDGFVMYGVQGRTCVAMGDPVGADEAVSQLIRAFIEKGDDFGGVPVFYDIGPAHMHRYADFGLTFEKLGEEAKVDLNSFTTEGGRGAKFRHAIKRLDKDGGVFRVAPVAEIPALRRGLLGTLPRGDCGTSGPRRGVQQCLAWCGRSRVVARLDALFRRRAQRRDGSLARAPDRMGEGRGLSTLCAGHGPAVGVRGVAARHAVEPARRLALRTRRVGLQLSRAARLQGEIQSDVGAERPRLSRWTAPAADPGRHLRPHRRRLPKHPAEMSCHRDLHARTRSLPHARHRQSREPGFVEWPS